MRLGSYRISNYNQTGEICGNGMRFEITGISSSSSSPLADDDSREERPSREMLSVSVEVDLEATKRERVTDNFSSSPLNWLAKIRKGE